MWYMKTQTQIWLFLLTKGIIIMMRLQTGSIGCNDVNDFNIKFLLIWKKLFNPAKNSL